MHTSNRAYALIDVAEIEPLQWRGGETRAVIRPDQTGYSYSLFLVSLEQAESRAVPAPSEVGYYLLKGQLKVASDLGTAQAAKGEYIHLPKEAAHELCSIGNERALVLAVFAPAGEDVWSESHANIQQQPDVSSRRMRSGARLHLQSAVSTFSFFGGQYGIRVSGEATAENFAQLDATYENGSGFPLMRLKADIGFFIREGALNFIIKNENIVLNAGQFLNIPKDTFFSFSSAGSDVVRVVITVAPAGFEKILTIPSQSSLPPTLAGLSEHLKLCGQSIGIEIR
jgi:quercetin dioxygenase-like cupin family protein